MQRIALTPVLVLMSLWLTACAAGPAGPRPGVGPPPGVGTPAAARGDLDDLFIRLRTTANDAEAQGIELEILHAWSTSGRPEIDALMSQGLQLVNSGDLDLALLTMDKVVEKAPDFAEGYNQRAAIHVMRDEYADAIRDIQKTLALEPRQFTALVGLGRILLLFDRQNAALLCFDAALALNPHLDAVRDQARQIREQLAGMEI